MWVLTILVLALQVIIWTSDLWLRPVTRLLKAASAGDELAEGVHPEGISLERDGTEGVSAEKASPEPVLQAFNPNMADSALLRSLGLSPGVVRNIIRYRNKGGQFRKPEDLAKIYGLDAETFNRLKSYIRLKAETPPVFKSQSTASRSESEAATPHLAISTTSVEAQAVLSVQPPESYAEQPLEQNLVQPEVIPITSSGIRFELNEADTATLQLLKGVGTVSAQRVVRYRDQLGGFYHVDQLKEIKGLYPTVLETLMKTVTVNSDKIVKININKASLERLRAHPYLDFYKAKVIVELRKNRKKISDLQELSVFAEFTPADLERLKWYLEL